MKVEKIIFLDIDGVMNQCLPPPRIIEGLEKDETFEEYCVDNLNSIVEETDCYFVISSAWRIYYDIERLKKIFELNGFKYSDRFLGYTENLRAHLSEHVRRGKEIDKWIKDNDFKGKFVILDDNDDMVHLKGWLVLTDSYEGLTDEKTESIKQRLS